MRHETRPVTVRTRQLTNGLMRPSRATGHARPSVSIFQTRAGATSLKLLILQRAVSASRTVASGLLSQCNLLVSA
jgi:hypothetical protein